MNAKCDSISLMSARDAYLNSFIAEYNLVAVNTLPFCEGANYTYVSYDNAHQTLIDYILAPAEMIDLCVCCSILDDNCINVSTHRPVLCTFHLPYLFDACLKSCNNDIHCINWKKATNENKILYNEMLANDSDVKLLSQTELQKCDLESAYSTLAHKMVMHAQKSFPRKKFSEHLTLCVLSATRTRARLLSFPLRAATTGRAIGVSQFEASFCHKTKKILHNFYKYSMQRHWKTTLPKNNVQSTRNHWCIACYFGYFHYSFSKNAKWLNTKDEE